MPRMTSSDFWRNTRRSGLLAAALVASSLVLAQGKGSASRTATPSPGGEIRIAHIRSATGPLEAYGKQTSTGFMMGLEYATEGTMMVAGKKLVVIEKDDQGKPDQGKCSLKQTLERLRGLTVRKTFDDWAKRDGCVGAAVPGKTSGKSSCKTHDLCDADVSVTLCTMDNMGHCWPGQPSCIYGTPNTDLSANDEMWEFFKNNPLP